MSRYVLTLTRASAPRPELPRVTRILVGILHGLILISVVEALVALVR